MEEPNMTLEPINSSEIIDAGGTTLQPKEISKIRKTDEVMELIELQLSLALDDNLEVFRQQCATLQRDYNQFVQEFGDLEPELEECDTLMREGKSIENCDLSDLKDSLRRFRTSVFCFNLENAMDQEEIGKVIGELDEVLSRMCTVVNNIEAKIDLFNEELEEGVQKMSRMFSLGILERIVEIEDGLARLKTLMEKFEVPPRSFLTETLERQMQALTPNELLE